MAITFIRGWLRYFLTIVIFALIFIVRPVPGVRAASITVNDTCSLKNAITAANTNTATGGCAAGSGADTITLSSDVEVLDRDASRYDSSHDRRRISHDFRVA